MNGYRSYMDRIRLDEEKQKRILEQAAAAAQEGDAEEKKVVWFRRKWVKIGAGVATAAAAAVVLITVLPVLGRQYAPQESYQPAIERESQQKDVKSAADNGAGTNVTQQAEHAAQEAPQSSAVEPAPAASDEPFGHPELYFLKNEVEVPVSKDLGKELEELITELTGGKAPASEGGEMTGAFHEADTEDSSVLGDTVSFLYAGERYVYDLQTGQLTDPENGGVLVLPETLRARVEEWLKEQK